jgi:hypothetical protein
MGAAALVRQVPEGRLTGEGASHMKNVACVAVIFVFCSLAYPEASNDPPSEKQRLNFLVGEWDSITIKQDGGEKSTGYSSIHWILGGEWLQWKFKGQFKSGSIEVLTLINYNEKRSQYALYSFNPFEDHPLPHFGRWIDSKTLRLEIDEDGKKIWVEFLIIEDGRFDQIHSEVISQDERRITGKTTYTRIGNK